MVSGQIIELLSSDEETTEKFNWTTSNNAAVTNPVEHNSSHVLAGLTKNLDFDFSSPERPEKKQKLNPRISNPSAGKSLSSLGPKRSCSTNAQKSSKLKLVEEEGGNVEEEDTIVFTSSAHISVSTQTAEPTSNLSGCRALLFNDDDSDELPENMFDVPPASSRLNSMLSEKTANILASLSAPSNTSSRSSQATSKIPKKNTKVQGSYARKGSNPAIESSSDKENVGSQTHGTRVKKLPRLTDEERALKKREKERAKAERASEREHEKAQRAKEKELDLERKRKLKEYNVQEKKKAIALAEVNRARIDKKESALQMIVDLPASIAGQQRDVSIRDTLRKTGVEVSTYQSSMPDLIKWRRKVKARWNSDLDHWEPLSQMRVEYEKHVMCLMQAKDFVERVTGQHEEDLDAHVARLKSSEVDSIPIYLIEDLNNWMNKNRNAQNRAFQAKVLAQASSRDDPSTQSQASKRKKPAPTIVDEDIIEDALLRLQVHHGCLIHHTETSNSAEWIAVFTQQISQIPFKTAHQKLDRTTFCMESGQVKTGENPHDTFIKMLKEVWRITEAVAHGIAAQYPDTYSLVQAFRRDGPYILEDLPKLANRNGVPSNSRIGPSISRRLYKVFLGTDPESTEV